MTDRPTPEERLRDAMHAYAEPVEPAPDAWARIRERVDRPTTRSRRARGWQLSLAGFAAAAAVVLVVAGLIALRADDNKASRVATPPTDATGGDEREPLPNLVAVKQDGRVVVITNADGRERQIADGADSQTTLAVTPDGKRVFFDRPGSESSECGPNREIVVVPAKGGRVRLIVENAADPALNPSGKRLAYVSYPGSGGCVGANTLVVQPAKVNPKASTVERWKAEGRDEVAAPSWAPDSRDLGFVFVQDRGTATYRVLDTKAKSLADARTVMLGPTFRSYGYFGASDQLLGLAPPSEAAGGFRLVVLDPETGEVVRVLFPFPSESAATPLSAMASPLGQNILYVTPIGGLYVWQEVAPTPVAFTEGIIAAAFLPIDAER